MREMLASAAKRLFLSTLEGLQRGSLELVLTERTHVFG
jgi:hypothetical protein